MEEDNFYEMDMRRPPEPDYRNLQRSPPAPPRAADRNDSVAKTPAPGVSDKLIRILLIVIIAVLAFLTALVIWNNIETLQAKENIESINQAVAGGYAAGNTPSATVPPANDPSKRTPTSCLELRQNGQSADGTYFIQASPEFSEERVFCDMTTDGGGWTLVASVHDNDIRKKCDSDDLWSDYLTSTNKDYIESAHWQNEMTFGDVRHATKRDYKNVAYSALNASDVMVWHVQISLPIEYISSVTKFQYRTTDHFLREYGGNLYSVFKKHFPLTPAKGNDLAHETAQRILTGLEVSRVQLKGYISDWYEYSWHWGWGYTYNPSIFRYSGNRINFYSTRCSSGVTYGYYGSCNGDFYWISSGQTVRTSPFFIIAVFYNDRKDNGDFRLRVNSDRLAGNVTKTDGVLHRGNYKLQYHVRQTTYGSSPTLCEFHFMATNVKDWKSIEPTSYSQSYAYSGSTFGHEFKASGNPQNIVMGYVMLTRAAGQAVTDAQTRNVANYILDKISTIPSLFQDYLQENSSLKVSVTFDKGSPTAFLETVPPNYRAIVDAGFVQFRAYNLAGLPNAFCPGVRANTLSPEYVCIGGISNYVGTKGTCGDFAGWEGTTSDSGSGSTAVGSAHAHTDIYSTILIFYR